MSGQNSQRVRRMASPASTKQGPMKATLTFGLMQGSPTRTANGRKTSPASSPTPPPRPTEGHRVKTRLSPDHRASPGRVSPSSPAAFVKVEKSKTLRHSPAPSIKRTGSLDTILAGPYLTGQWPRDPRDLLALSTPSPTGTFDKATQTPEEWEDSLDKKKKGSHKRSASLGNGDTRKELLKARLGKSKDISRSSSQGTQRTSPVQGAHLSYSTGAPPTSPVTTLITTKPIPVPVSINIPKPVKIRASVEGLNQEIERALKCISGNEEELRRVSRTQEPTPDGHRAPVLELLSGGGTRSIDTQTPSGFLDRNKISEESSSGSSSRSQSESPSFPIIIPGLGPLTIQDTSSSSSSASSSSSPSTASQPSSRSNSAEGIIDIKEAEGVIDIKETKKEEADGEEMVEDVEDQEVEKKTEEKWCKEVEKDSEEGEGVPEYYPKYAPSPKPNKSFAFVREPPDGCEKVKIIEEARPAPPVKEPLLSCPIKKPSSFRIPSVDSAFCPLYKPYMSQASELALKTTPPTPNTAVTASSGSDGP